MALVCTGVRKCSFILLKEYFLKDVRKGRVKPRIKRCLINQGIATRTPSSLADGHEGSHYPWAPLRDLLHSEGLRC